MTVTKARMLGLLAGDTDVLDLLLSVLEKGDPDFNIVTP